MTKAITIEKYAKIVKVNYLLDGKELKFKPGDYVVVSKVREASSVGYLGTRHKILDYINNPHLLTREKDGSILYPCESGNGWYTRWHDDELK